MNADQNQNDKTRPAARPSAILTFVGFGMDPDAVTEAFGIQPTCIDVRPVRHCDSGRKEECGLWSFDTAQSISSPDIGEHIEQLIALFRPIKSRIEEIRPKPNIFLQLRCEPVSLLRPLIAPRIEPRHVAALADLGASLTVELLPHAR
jgi:hypothetical protein